MGQSKTILLEKLREALSSVLPIVLIVLVLCFSIAPIPTATLMTFLIGAVLLIGGMGLFTLGADQAMTPIGERVGAAMTRSRKLWIVVSVSFLIGVIVTVSEPDLQVLATQVPGVPNPVLIDIGHAHANGGIHLLGNAQERAAAQELGEDEVIDQDRAQRDGENVGKSGAH